MALQTRSHYTYTCDGCGKQVEGFGSAEPEGWRSVPEETRFGPPPYRHLCSLECAERYGSRTWRGRWHRAQGPTA